MGSTKTRRGLALHSSISINTRDSSETMYCGLHIERDNLLRDWRQPTCKRCVARKAKDRH